MSLDPSRTLPAEFDERQPGALRMFAARVAGLIDTPIAHVLITPEAATASPREVGLQVRDRLDEPWADRWTLLVLIGTAAYAAGGTQTVTWTVGSPVEVIADEVYLVVTDSQGAAVLELDAAAGTRHVTAVVLGRADASGAITIT